MTTPIAIEVNCETGEVIERPLTADEIAANAAAAEQAVAEQAQREAEATAKAEAKAQAIAALVALGLTEAQVAALTA
jgi:Holliday junction resolvasome RuvABC DNA-binding subunit